jgi:agmatine deiminase
MAWPVRAELWGGRLGEARAEYAAVARAIAAFEPVAMVCPPELVGQVRDACGGDIDVWDMPINDSWMRDSGPVFLRDGAGRAAVVSFGFNAWGRRWSPYDDDARVASRVADRLGLPCFHAPFVLEGGAYFVDGAGTLVTTEQCLLAPNRNPDLSREQIEQGLGDYLGVRAVVWLPVGHSLDVGPEGTDGHVDGVLQYVGPAHVLLEAPRDPAASEYAGGRRNAAALAGARDAAGRPFTVSILDTPAAATAAYANHYLANGAVIVPVNGGPGEEAVLQSLTDVYPGREIVGVTADAIAFGGGGPHCITQQVPAGVELG